MVGCLPNRRGVPPLEWQEKVGGRGEVAGRNKAVLIFDDEVDYRREVYELNPQRDSWERESEWGLRGGQFTLKVEGRGDWLFYIQGD